MQGYHVSAFHPTHGKAGTAINFGPKGSQPRRGSRRRGDFKAELGARRMEKIEALLAEPGLRIIAWIINLISSSQRMGAGSV
jgi:hypothetical protein